MSKITNATTDEARPSRPYSARDWYWFVGGDETRVFSSLRVGYFPISDQDYQDHLARGGRTTRIPSEAELADVLRPYGIIVNPLTQARDARASAYIAELGKSAAPDFQQTIGDVLDTLIAQVAFLTVATGNGTMPEFGAMLAKISDIKARFPKK